MTWLLCLLACGGGDETAPNGSGSSPPTEDVTGDTDATDVTEDTSLVDSASTVDSTAPPTDTVDTGSTTSGVPMVKADCSNLNPIPATYETFTWVQAAEDFTFSGDGSMLAVHGGQLKATEFGGAQTLLIPNLGDVRGTRVLPDGRLAMAHIETGTVIVVDPTTGGQVTHSGLTNPNGIAIGSDGRVYVATYGKIVAIDPDTSAQEVVAQIDGHSFDGLTFSPDYRRLYFNEEFGKIHWVDFDAKGTPGPVVNGPSIPMGPASLLDGMAADACGNLYTTEMGSTVWRVTTSGVIEKVVQISGIAILPALNFGTGQGGWDADKLYVMDFLGKMYAVDVGVPGKWEPHHQ